jgi:hypothetical protein
VRTELDATQTSLRTRANTPPLQSDSVQSNHSPNLHAKSEFNITKFNVNSLYRFFFIFLPPKSGPLPR